QRIAIGVNDVALRFLHRDIADGGQRSRALIVDNLIGGQNVVVVVDFDVAARDDAVSGFVVNQLVALQPHRLRAVNVGVDLAEHASFRKRRGLLFVSGRERITGGTAGLGKSGAGGE